MDYLNIAINLFFIVACGIVTYYALRRYFTTRFNHTHTLYWGLSFIVIGGGFAIYLVDALVGFGHYATIAARVVHMSDSLGWWLQLLAVMYSVGFCSCAQDKVCNKSFCTRKTQRTALMALLLALLMIPAFVPYYYDTSATQGIITLQRTNAVWLDVFYETIHAAIAFTIVYYVRYAEALGIYLSVGFAFVGISELLQLVNILAYGYTEMSLLNIEWALAVVGMLVIMVEVVGSVWRDEREND